MQHSYRHVFGIYFCCLLPIGCGGDAATVPQQSSEGNSAERTAADAALRKEQAGVSSTNGDTQHPARTGPNLADQTNTAGGDDVNVFEQVTYQIRDWNETKVLIAAQQGRVVVVDLWSTSCLPCMREFPNLVSLQKKYGDKIACISVNVNYLGIKPAPSEQMQEQVLTFLKKHDARIHNIISSVPDEKLYQQLEIASIPIIYVYDKSGKLRKRFDNEQVKKAEDEFTYEKNVIPLVEQLLAEE